MSSNKVFFISDLHFGHKNCLAFDNRPFKTIEEQDNEIIKRWNSAVSANDEVWILGDISRYNATKTIEIFNQLNGIKHLCIGNHDKKLLKKIKNNDIIFIKNKIYYFNRRDKSGSGKKCYEFFDFRLLQFFKYP